MVIIKRYRFFIVTLVILGVLFIVNKQYGLHAIRVTGYSLKEMALIIPPIFILLGLLDVWVPRETMIRFMGDDSGLKGIVLALILGSAAAGPLYGAFPIAAIFMKKGVKFTNVLIFIGAWSTTKIPMFLFELSALGGKFAITRLLVDIPGIIIIAYFLAKIIPNDEIKQIYARAEQL